MAFEFKLPDIGEGVVEGELTKWLVDEGAEVAEDTPLFEVLTDKVSAVIPSPRRGRVAKRHFGEGDVVPVGAVVLTIEESGAAPTAAASAPTAHAQAAPIASYVAAPAAPVAPVAPAAGATIAAPVTALTQANERVRAAPATRKLARSLGVDITRVAGTGDHGRVTQEDVTRAHAGASPAAAAPRASAPTAAVAPPRAPATPAAPVAPTALGADEVTKLLGLRRKISERMRHSRDTAAHFTYVDEVDFTAISALKDQLRDAGLRTTYLPFVMKAVAIVLQRPEFHSLNAHVDYQAGTLTKKAGVHLGIATATDAGLLVPVVQDVHGKSLRTLVGELSAVADAARANALPVASLSGSTFTITSLGKAGGMFATPIINQPEVAILGLHKIEKRPVVVGDAIVIRERMYMSCSFDHRIIDGHIGAAFVQAVRELLEAPALLLADLR